jgi:hypothetical protein
MNKVRVDKPTIVARITENRRNHRAVYERAMEGYRKKAVARLNDVIDALKEGKSPNLYVNLPVPEDHTGDYDVILDMLSSSIDNYVELDEHGFRRFVRDEWEWKERFNITNSGYIAS